MIIKNKNFCVGVQLRAAGETILPCTQLLLHEVTGATYSFPKTVFWNRVSQLFSMNSENIEVYGQINFFLPFLCLFKDSGGETRLSCAEFFVHEFPGAASRFS